MIRALVVDDEPLARRGIRQLLEAHDDIAVAGECRNGREAVDAIVAGALDLVFLDVQMPELDGFGVLREIGAMRMPAVVFVTAYDTFAVRAFEAHALDYLVKPVSEARFAAALARVRARIAAAGALEEAMERAQRLEALLAEHALAHEPRPASRLVVPTAAGDLVLDTAEIDWIQADDYYAAVHALGRRHLIRESLASLEQRLDPSQFARVHRSAIVRLDRVRELRATPLGETLLVLRDGTRIPVSRRRRESVAELVRGLG